MSHLQKRRWSPDRVFAPSPDRSRERFDVDRKHRSGVRVVSLVDPEERPGSDVELGKSVWLEHRYMTEDVTNPLDHLPPEQAVARRRRQLNEA
ncbi:hypothetical protein [Lentzea sp. NEAU-D7]|uniref:hypothetical protein n=1 Tax=Lentzea sp. NEAU-D7 TaxID=2994667 RepID=UPI00224B338B|nr:hypothetical protein [Lentzea sp. NEAU-D7]MCX2948995.1 hypothetical protein [Lentzea sp. NEAU-D7]